MFVFQTFLDAPFPCRGRSDVEGIFSPPYYEWFTYDIVSKLCIRNSFFQHNGSNHFHWKHLLAS